MPEQRSVPHTKDEILSDTYGDFYREQERIKKNEGDGISATAIRYKYDAKYSVSYTIVL